MATLIALVWLATYTRAFLDPGFHIPDGINPIAMIAVGFLCGSGILSTKDDEHE